jgi:tRNA nucleotidyltransferase (CCA-adding enzyme)
MDALLEPYSELALLATYVATDDQTVCDVIALYQSHLRWIKPHLDGHDLRELGLEPGPIYKEILSALRAAVLDNEVQTRAEEEALVKRMIRELDGDYSE